MGQCVQLEICFHGRSNNGVEFGATKQGVKMISMMKEKKGYGNGWIRRIDTTNYAPALPYVVD